MTLPGPAVDRLEEVVGPHVVTDPELIASSTTDWTGRFVGHSPAVVRPGSTSEVAGVVAVCRELGLALVPQGGNTGLVGGGVPLHGEVVLSLGRLDDLEPVDDRAGQITVGAGVTLAASAAGGRRPPAGPTAWTSPAATRPPWAAPWPPTPADCTSSATGPPGPRWPASRRCSGPGAVVSHLGGLVKDNTGYDWPGLVCGSEGTLAVVTRARLRLVPPLPFRTAALLAFATVPDALEAAGLVPAFAPLARGLRALPGPGGRSWCAR